MRTPEYDTVGSHLSKLQLSKHVGYPNAFTKPHPLFLATFVDRKLVVAVQMANIEDFGPRSTRCMAAEDRLTSKGKVGFSRKVKPTVKVSRWVPLVYRMHPVEMETEQ